MQISFYLLAVYVDEGAAFGLSTEASDLSTRQTQQSVEATGVPFLSVKIEQVFEAHSATPQTDDNSNTACRRKLGALLQVSVL